MLCLFPAATVSALPRLPGVPLPHPRGVSQRCLCALDALEATEVPAFLQTGSHSSQLLSEGAGQPRKKSLHLAGVYLHRDTQIGGKMEFMRLIESLKIVIKCFTTGASS